MFAFTILSAALLASQVSANAILGRSPLVSLLRIRQTGGFDPSDIPSECTVQCATTSEVLGGTSCTTVSCLCTAQVNLGFQQCLQCLIDVAGDSPSLITQSQDALEQYEDACKSSGVSLTSLTISGAASATASGSSISLPSGSASASASVFFTSTAGGGAISSSGSVRATSSRAVITAISSSAESTASSTAVTDGNNAQGANNNGASVAVAGLSTIVLTGLAGALLLGL
ncbi:hypothetical protein QCA50_015000 [Cerrena zonata]|uniref:Extracellular membrane protein CFEM domain-containing protein n=1 Tax=Cerrena zonata TaxID=2478898 RepID=A0AAW0FXD8_9APHY